MLQKNYFRSSPVFTLGLNIGFWTWMRCWEVVCETNCAGAKVLHQCFGGSLQASKVRAKVSHWANFHTPSVSLPNPLPSSLKGEGIFTCPLSFYFHYCFLPPLQSTWFATSRNYKYSCPFHISCSDTSMMTSLQSSRPFADCSLFFLWSLATYSSLSMFCITPSPQQPNLFVSHPSALTITAQLFLFSFTIFSPYSPSHLWNSTSRTCYQLFFKFFFKDSFYPSENQRHLLSFSYISTL